ncbi:TniQ family protein [Herbaspirillum robiniae]|uniref:TniQ family protein n=1 Tax=Herbaspirillum robiniae TaxID=2014887 RepID=A0ABX2M1J5_9BURK|nr:TniQ family protein [Herbaspirillum robiniae]NUU03848.1 TniQ family protein [Herbaspirillum robiniae]
MPDPDDLSSSDLGDFQAPAGRTWLYRIEPANMGGREALTSYIIRLSRRHMVNPRILVQTVFAQVDKRIEGVANNRFYTKDGRTINALGLYARMFAGVVGTLTGRDDIEQLTMLPWQDVLPENGEALIARAPKWCPFCFAEQARSIGYAYLPLAWQLALYRRCLRHGVPLIEACPRCLRLQPFIPAFPDVGHCAHCGVSLCYLGEEIPQAYPSEMALEASIEEMLQSVGVRPSLNDFKSNLLRLIQYRTAGNKSRFCKELGWDSWAANAWLQKGKKPTLRRLLDISFHHHVPVAVLCSGRLVVSPLPPVKSRRESRSAQKSRAKRPKLSTAQVRNLRGLLTGFLKSSPPLTLNAIVRILELRRSVLKYWCPEECQMISARYLKHKALTGGEQTERRVVLLSKILEECVHTGQSATRRHVDQLLRKNGLALIRPELLQLYRKFHSDAL